MLVGQRAGSQGTRMPCREGALVRVQEHIVPRVSSNPKWVRLIPRPHVRGIGHEDLRNRVATSSNRHNYLVTDQVKGHLNYA